MIGILAGMGPYSTAPFLNLVLKQCEAQYGAREDIDFPKVVIYSWPTPFYPDRPVDHSAMIESLKAGLHSLDKSEARLLAIACNTAHAYFPEIEKDVTKPLMNMVNLAVEALPAQASKIAVISSRITAESGIYQAKLKRSGFTVIEPDWQNAIDELIGSIRFDPNSAKRKARSLMDLAESDGADCVVIACLDLSAVREQFVSKISVIDASQVLAKNLVKGWLELNKGKK